MQHLKWSIALNMAIALTLGASVQASEVDAETIQVTPSQKLVQKKTGEEVIFATSAQKVDVCSAKNCKEQKDKKGKVICKCDCKCNGKKRGFTKKDKSGKIVINCSKCCSHKEKKGNVDMCDTKSDCDKPRKKRV